MFGINDYVIYKREVCIVIDILKKYLKDNDYYLLQVLSDESLKIKVPISSKEIRPLLTIQEVNNLIEKIPDIPICSSSLKSLENIYKELMKTCQHEDLIKIIKTTYLRNQERIINNKKTTDKDNYFFNLAERYLYQEFSVVLNLSYDETREYVISKVNELTNS